VDKRSIIILLSILILVGVGCDDNSLEPVRTDDPVPDTEKDWVQDYLAALWEASNHGDWDVISGTVNPVTGGVVSGVPASWPAGFVFSVDIPPRALLRRQVEVAEPQPLNKGLVNGGHHGGNDYLLVDPIITPVQISIHVPRYYPGVPLNYDYPAVYRLEPHSLTFSRPVEVTFCFPPWIPDTPSYHKFHFWREGGDPDWTYFYSDHEMLSPQGGDPRTELVFETLHFSRWGLENGSGGGGGKSWPE